MCVQYAVLSRRAEYQEPRSGISCLLGIKHPVHHIPLYYTLTSAFRIKIATSENKSTAMPRAAVRSQYGVPAIVCVSV